MVPTICITHPPTDPNDADHFKDSSITKMTYKMRRSFWLSRFKVQRTRRLFEKLKAEKRDGFVMFSSLSGVVGYIGRVYYAAASTFKNTFIQQRKHVHLSSGRLLLTLAAW